MDELLAQHIRRQMVKGYLRLISQSHGYTGKRFKAKRRLRDREGIQVNGRLYVEIYKDFRRVQAENNLNQRQLTYVLINKAVQLAGYRLP